MTFDIRAQTNPVMDELIEKVTNAITQAVKAVGAESEISMPIEFRAADDDEETTLDAKTGYIGLGANLSPGLHHPEMEFDLKALQHGQKILSKIVHKRLG